MPAAATYVANAAGFVVSVMTNYYLNRRWTFRSTNDVAGELPKFFTVSLVAYGGQLGIFWLLREQAHVAPIPSQLHRDRLRHADQLRGQQALELPMNQRPR